jgi:ABC-type uncharacterized transport system substrate-binding protein
MKRRDLLILAMASAVGWPVAAAGQGRMRTVGILVSLPLNDVQWTRLPATKSYLEKLGWIENRNIRFELRSTFGGPAALATAVKELVDLNPDVILASSSAETAALAAATRTIPIIFATAADPVGNGFVQSLARPGGNVTGFTNSHAAMGGKWLQFLKEIAPGTARVGVLFNPRTAPRGGRYFLEPMEEAAPSLGIALTAAPLDDPKEIDAAVAAFAGEPPGGNVVPPSGLVVPPSGLVVPPDSFTVAHRAAIVAAAARHRVPTIYSFRYFMAAGGLISYGADLEVRGGQYIDLILKGAKPADLPVQSPRKYELLINLKAAEALGLKVPMVLLARADQIIE